jgi:hypothetical protein
MPSTPTLMQLISNGAVPVGAKLHHAARGKLSTPEVEAQVTREGIKVAGRLFKSPSAAARSITGKPVDGWHWWKLPTGEPLDSLRPK